MKVMHGIEESCATHSHSQTFSPWNHSSVSVKETQYVREVQAGYQYYASGSYYAKHDNFCEIHYCYWLAVAKLYFHNLVLY